MGQRLGQNPGWIDYLISIIHHNSHLVAGILAIVSNQELYLLWGDRSWEFRRPILKLPDPTVSHTLERKENFKIAQRPLEYQFSSKRLDNQQQTQLQVFEFRCEAMSFSASIGTVAPQTAAHWSTVVFRLLPIPHKLFPPPPQFLTN